ncbi:MAG: hypothetical protein KJ749_11795 [Planctomycetes bacterium]|nr:hypothetical protein [Planctomycetota bacterium]
MTLTANRDVPHYVDQAIRTLQVGSVEHIYKGAFVSVDASGYAAPLAAGETFMGIAFEECDNSGGDDGDRSIRVYTLGDFDHALGGAAVTDIGALVFASDDATLTLSNVGTSLIGHVVDVPSSGVIIVRIQPFHLFT